jgi:hypothetical protein
MTFSIIGLFATLSMNNNQPNVMLSFAMSVVMLSVVAPLSALMS